METNQNTETMEDQEDLTANGNVELSVNEQALQEDIEYLEALHEQCQMMIESSEFIQSFLAMKVASTSTAKRLGDARREIKRLRADNVAKREEIKRLKAGVR